MPVSKGSIAVGHCYVVEPSKQVRKVLKIENSKVTYAHRGKKASSGWAPNRVQANIETFAAAVDRTVTEDYDPDYPERSPEKTKKPTLKKKKKTTTAARPKTPKAQKSKPRKS